MGLPLAAAQGTVGGLVVLSVGRYTETICHLLRSVNTEQAGFTLVDGTGNAERSLKRLNVIDSPTIYKWYIRSTSEREFQFNNGKQARVGNRDELT